MNSIEQLHNILPIRHGLRSTYLFSLTIVFIMAIASIWGILFQSSIYPTEELVQNFMPNDIVNLLIGVPILLGSILFTSRGKLIGLLFWPGALLYVFYNYVAYMFAIPFNAAYILYLLLVTLSAYTIISLVASINASSVKEQLRSNVSERLAGGVIAGLGLLFLMRVTAMMVLATVNQSMIGQVELAVMIADFLVGPAMIGGGILLWQQKPLGYVSGTGLLFQLSMLFIGLIIFMLLQPLITPADLNLIDTVIVFVMGMISFIPFGLFIRGVISAGD